MILTTYLNTVIEIMLKSVLNVIICLVSQMQMLRFLLTKMVLTDQNQNPV